MVEMPVVKKNYFFPLDQSGYFWIVNNQPRYIAMYQDNDRAGNYHSQEVGCADQCPAKDGSQHNGDNIVERHMKNQMTGARRSGSEQVL